MPENVLVLDGTMAYGTPNSGVITIDSIVYILENVNVDRGVSNAMTRDGRGVPNRQRFTADVPTLTADLQLATSSTAYPAFGETFTITVDAHYGSETFIVQPQAFVATNGEGDIRIAPLKATKAINPSAVTVVAAA